MSRQKAKKQPPISRAVLFIFAKIKELSDEKVSKPSNEELVSVENAFIQAMDDDFNTPVAISELLRFVKIASKILETKDQNLTIQANFIVKMFEDVLGFDFKYDTIKAVDNNEEKLLGIISSIRQKLRETKNYELSDYVRDELGKININISDKKL